MKKVFVMLIALATLALAGCETAPRGTKTALELQAIQAREFESTKKQTFAATLSVFQDLGYIVSSASYETGLITAKSPTQQSFIPFVGNVMTDRKATAFVEEIGKGRTKVRLNVVDSRNISQAYGVRSERDTPLETPDYYQEAFSKIQQAIFIRKNLD